MLGSLASHMTYISKIKSFPTSQGCIFYPRFARAAPPRSKSLDMLPCFYIHGKGHFCPKTGHFLPYFEILLSHFSFYLFPFLLFLFFPFFLKIFPFGSCCCPVLFHFIFINKCFAYLRTLICDWKFSMMQTNLIYLIYLLVGSFKKQTFLLVVYL